MEDFFKHFLGFNLELDDYSKKCINKFSISKDTKDTEDISEMMSKMQISKLPKEQYIKKVERSKKLKKQETEDKIREGTDTDSKGEYKRLKADSEMRKGIESDEFAKFMETELVNEYDEKRFMNKLAELKKSADIKDIIEMDSDSDISIDSWSNLEFDHSRYGYYKGDSIEILNVIDSEYRVSFDRIEYRMPNEVTSNCKILDSERNLYTCTYEDNFKEGEIEEDLDYVMIIRKDLAGIRGRKSGYSGNRIILYFDMIEVKKINRQDINGDKYMNCEILKEVSEGIYECKCSYSALFDVGDYLPEVIIWRDDLYRERGLLISKREERVNIRSLETNNNYTVRGSDIFYKDILLKDKKYLNVEYVETDGEKYIIGGRREDTNEKIEIVESDILEKNIDFKIYRKNESKDKRDDEHIISEQEYIVDDETKENIMVSTFKDIERVAPTSSKLSKQEQQIKTYIEKINKEVDLGELDEYNLIKEILKTISNVANYMGKVNLYGSLIDIAMIVACVSYIKLGIEDNIYFSKLLYDKGYFPRGIDTSFIVQKADDLDCDLSVELSRKGKERDSDVSKNKIIKAMSCYIRLIQSLGNMIGGSRNRVRDILKDIYNWNVQESIDNLLE